MSDLYQPDSALDLLQYVEGNSEARRHYLYERFDRIREFDVQLKAMAAVRDPNAALRAMDHVRGPLGGLPVVIKDIFDTHDLVTAYGSPIYTGHRPASDAAFVEAALQKA